MNRNDADARSRCGRRPGPIRAVARAGVLLLGLLAAPGPFARSQEAGAGADLAGPGATGAGVSASSTIAAGSVARTPAVEARDRSAGSGFLGVARESIFGDAYDVPWKPLPFRTLFSEGWDEAWVAEPDVSGDSQQGWINAADGNFYRLYFFSYDFTNRPASVGDGHTGAYTVYLPLSRRLELVTVVPFVTSQPTLNAAKQTFPGSDPGRPGHPRSTGFGDLTFTPRVMLHEADDFTLVAQASVQIPTGDRRAGAGQAIVSPGVQYWWNFAEGWVMRGGFSPSIGTNRQAGGTTLLSQLALGKTFTPADVPLFGDFTVYLSANAFNTVSSSRTSATLTPGFRTHLGQGYYALAGIEVPVTGPNPFRENAIFWIMKTF